MKRFFYFLVLLIFGGLVFVIFVQQKSSLFLNTTNKSDLTHYQKGYRFNQNGWIYVHIEGGAYERGFQHGHLLANEIQEILKNVRALTYWDTGKNWDFFVSVAERLFIKHLDHELLEEIKGIADGASSDKVTIKWQDILAWNGFEELLDYWWPTIGEKMITGKEKEHCSAFIATGSATKDGKIVVAHNSWNIFETGQYINLILDLKPDLGYRIFMQSVPGCVFSRTDFFLTGAGIVGTETTISGFNVYQEKVPTFVRIRHAMQYAKNIDELIDIMKKENSGGYANSWLLADLTTNEIVLFELGLNYAHVERKKDGYFIGFNSAYDPQIRNLECVNDGFTDIRRSQGARRVRLTELLETYYGKIDIKIAQKILADHYDVYLKKNNPCSRTIDGHYELDALEYVSQSDAPTPFRPRGTVDGKVMDYTMAKNMSFLARWGSSSDISFDAKKFIAQHIQWQHLAPYLKNRLSQPWTVFKSDER